MYYTPLIWIAADYRTSLVRETPGWRANPEWARKLGYDQRNLDEINFLGYRGTNHTHVAAICARLLGAKSEPKPAGI